MKKAANMKVISLILAFVMVLSIAYIPMFKAEAIPVPRDENKGWQYLDGWRTAKVIDFDDGGSLSDIGSLNGKESFYILTGTCYSDGNKEFDLMGGKTKCYLMFKNFIYVSEPGSEGPGLRTPFIVYMNASLFILLDGVNGIATKGGSAFDIGINGNLYIDEAPIYDGEFGGDETPEPGETGDPDGTPGPVGTDEPDETPDPGVAPKLAKKSSGDLTVIGKEEGFLTVSCGGGFQECAIGNKNGPEASGNITVEGGIIRATGGNGGNGINANNLSIYGGSIVAETLNASTAANAIAVNKGFKVFGGEISATGSESLASIKGPISVYGDGTPTKITYNKGGGPDATYLDSNGDNISNPPVMVAVKVVDLDGNPYEDGLKVTVRDGGPSYTTYDDGCVTFMAAGNPSPAMMKFELPPGTDGWGVQNAVRAIHFSSAPLNGTYRLVNIDVLVGPDELRPTDIPEPKYPLTVINGSGTGNYEQGAIVEIVADPNPSDPPDPLFKEWEFDWMLDPSTVQYADGTESSDRTAKIVMIDKPVTATGIFTARFNPPTPTPKPIVTEPPIVTVPPTTPPVGDGVLYGNVNGDPDDVVDGEDLICLKRFILDWDDYIGAPRTGFKGPGCLDPEFDAEKLYADVDGDGEAGEGEDLICLKRFILDWDDYLPGAAAYKGPGCKDSDFDPVGKY